MAKIPRSYQSLIRRAVERLLARIKRERRKDPEPGSPMDPYAYVGAPKKPRPLNRSGAAVAELPEE